MAEETRLDVLQAERFSQQRIVIEVDLTGGKIVGCTPKRVNLSQFLRGERVPNLDSFG
jgi:hypothetical protein